MGSLNQRIQWSFEVPHFHSFSLLQWRSWVTLEEVRPPSSHGAGRMHPVGPRLMACAQKRGPVSALVHPLSVVGVGAVELMPGYIRIRKSEPKGMALGDSLFNHFFIWKSINAIWYYGNGSKIGYQSEGPQKRGYWIIFGYSVKFSLGRSILGVQKIWAQPYDHISNSIMAWQSVSSLWWPFRCSTSFMQSPSIPWLRVKHDAVTTARHVANHL